MALTKDRPLVTPHSLQGRTAKAMYDAANTTLLETPPAYWSLSQVERDRYERMAAAALGVVLKEPVTG